MNRIKAGFIFSLLITQFCAFAQNWDSVGSPLTSQVRYLYTDTANNVLLASGSVSAYQRFLQYSPSLDWDTLSDPIGGAPFQITNYRGDYYAVNYHSASGGFNAVGKLINNTWQPFARTRNIAFGFYQHDTSLYVMGTFDSIGGIAATGIARYDGNNWHSYNVGLGGGSGAGCAIIFQGDLYVGGGFHDTIGNCLAKFDGVQWQGFGNFFSGGFDAVNCMAEYNGELYVGGYFTTSSGSPGNFIARWDGTTWTQVGGGLWSGQVLAMKVFDGELWVGGQFIMAGGISTPYLAKYDGTDWCNVGNFDNGIGGIEVYNGELYVAGGFWSIDGDSSRAYVAKWVGGNNTGACGHLNTGIEDQTLTTTTVNVFPNPVTETATFKFTGLTSKAVIRLFDALGREIWSENVNGSQAVFSAEGQPIGMYFYRLDEEGKSPVTGKLIIQ